MDSFFVACPQGHKLKAQSKFIGKVLPCPKCGTKFRVDAPAAPASSDLNPLGDDPLATPASSGDPLGLGGVDLGSIPAAASNPFENSAVLTSPSFPHAGGGGALPAIPMSGYGAAPGASTTARPAATSGNKKLWWILGGVAVGIVALTGVVIVVGAVILMSGSTEQTATGVKPSVASSSTTPAVPSASAASPYSADPNSPNVPTTTAPSPNSAAPLTSAAPTVTSPSASPPAPAKQGGFLSNLLPTLDVKDDYPAIEDKLKKIATGLHDLHDSYQYMIPPTNLGDGPSPPSSTRLSWRVHVLPYVGERELHESFHFDEPWDSPHNLTLIGRMPAVYRTHRAEKDHTRFRIFTGPGGLIQPNERVTLRDFQDGASNVLLVVTVGPDQAVPWTKPDTLAVDAANPWAPFGKLPDNFTYVALADTGIMRILSTNVPNDKLLQMIDPRDGATVAPLDYHYVPRKK